MDDIEEQRQEELEELKEGRDFWSGARYAAEELAWPLAFLAGYVAKLQFGSWWAAVAVATAAFFLTVRYFGRKEEAAEDAFYRARGVATRESQ